MTATRPKLTESDVTAQVVSFFQHHSWHAIRMNRGLVSMPYGGVVQFGEPGMPDYQFVRYYPTARHPASALVVWCELKATGKKAQCRCRTKKARQRCTSCDQRAWRERERQAGAAVWVVDSIDWVMEEYDRVFGFLHSGESARGQMDLLAGVRG
jgi:hypothetical protein